MTRNQPLFRAAVVSAAVVFLLAGGAGRAEVGVYDMGLGSRPYELKIIEDPDPVTNVWRPVHPGNGNFVILNPQGETNGDGRPAMLLHPITSEAIVSWSRAGTGGFDVVVSRFESGAWTVPEVVAGSPDDELHPALAVDPSDGSVHIAYWVNDASPRIMHVQAPADLSSWSSPTQVSQLGEVAARPDAIFYMGDLRVVYETHNSGIGGTPRQIVLATKDGGDFTSEVVAASGHGEENLPLVHTSMGRLWVDWIDDFGQMTWTRRESSGSWTPLQTEGFSGVEERDFHVRGLIRALAIK